MVLLDTMASSSGETDEGLLPTEVDASRKTSSFEALPKEIRLMIYSYLIPLNDEVLPFPTPKERHELLAGDGRPPEERLYMPEGHEYHPMPSSEVLKYAHEYEYIGLLAVSKGIRDEVAAILFGSNTWRISTLENGYWGTEAEFWRAHASRIRVLDTQFTWRDVDPIRLEYWRSCAPHGRSGHNWLHTEVVNAQRTNWRRRWWLIDEMHHLQSLEIDVAALWCPLLCCRQRGMNLTLRQNLRTYLRYEVGVKEWTSMRIMGLETLPGTRRMAMRGGQSFNASSQLEQLDHKDGDDDIVLDEDVADDQDVLTNEEVRPMASRPGSGASSSSEESGVSEDEDSDQKSDDESCDARAKIRLGLHAKADTGLKLIVWGYRSLKEVRNHIIGMDISYPHEVNNDLTGGMNGFESD